MPWIKVRDKNHVLVRVSTDTISRYRVNIERNGAGDAVAVGTHVIFGNGDDNVLMLDIATLDKMLEVQELG